jgi:hypothetical protein
MTRSQTELKLEGKDQTNHPAASRFPQGRKFAKVHEGLHLHGQDSITKACLFLESHVPLQVVQVIFFSWPIICHIPHCQDIDVEVRPEANCHGEEEQTLRTLLLLS